MTVRLLPAPCADPPYDRLDNPQPAPRDHRRPAIDQRPLPLLFVLPSGLPADPVFDRQRTGTGALPDPGTWVARLARATVEVHHGARPVTQLRRWLTDEVYDQVSRSAGRRTGRVAERRRRYAPERSPRVVLRTVRTCEVADGLVEACAVVDDGQRAWALALRLEGADGRWRCTILEWV